MGKMIFLLLFLVFIVSNSFSKPTIAGLTSRETASQIEGELPSGKLWDDFSQKNWVSVGLGQTYLMGNFHETGANAMGFDAFYHFVASARFDFMANFHYSEHKSQTEQLKLPSLHVGIKYKFFEKDSFSTYTMGGLGFYYPKAVHSGGIETDSKMTTGLHVGTGIDLGLNAQYAMGFLGQFHKPFTVRQEKTRDLSGAYFNLMTYFSYKFF